MLLSIIRYIHGPWEVQVLVLTALVLPLDLGREYAGVFVEFFRVGFVPTDVWTSGAGDSEAEDDGVFVVGCFCDCKRDSRLDEAEVEGGASLRSGVG
jgi:hypothetical protein